VHKKEVPGFHPVPRAPHLLVNVTSMTRRASFTRHYGGDTIENIGKVPYTLVRRCRLTL